MKLFSSELGQNYDTYTFGYAQYAQREKEDSLSDIYGKGYLPYSGAQNVRDIFYMARSARVPLAQWEMNSENRRIAKKFDGQFERTRTPWSTFKPDEQFLSFCLAYFAGRHGERAMPRARLEHILTCGVITDLINYTQNGKLVAHVLEAADKAMGHYWFSFYDTSYAQQSLGMWLMLDCVRDANDRGLLHYYLGTVYGEKALYKTNFEPLEWWDGSSWNPDAKSLRERGHTDHTQVIPGMDEWKKGQKFF